MDNKVKFIFVQKENHFNELMQNLKHFTLSGILTDVALVTGPDIFHVHHLILSCFSNYFKYILENENVKYFIYTDHKKTILQAIVDYLYCGMVHVPQIYKHQLETAATSLRVKGFMSMNLHNKGDGKATVMCPNHQSQLTQSMWESRQMPYKNDVIFIVDNKHKVYAHACVIGACSSFLLKIFTKYGIQRRKPFIIVLPYVQKEALEIVLEFCYKGEIKISLSDVQSVYKLAELMGIQDLCKILVRMSPNDSPIMKPTQDNQTNSVNIIRNSVVPTALSDLLKHEKLVDVFIFNCGKLFKAHSVILSMYSTYFKQLAKYLDYDMKDIFVLMKDFQSRNIQSMLDYIYTGETKFEGNTREFYESMSDLLDLNILPVSSCNIAKSNFSQIKDETSGNNTSSGSSKTEKIQETVLKIDISDLKNEECFKKQVWVMPNIVYGESKFKNVKENEENNVPDVKEENEKDGYINKISKTLLSRNILTTGINNKSETINCDQSVPEIISRNNYSSNAFTINCRDSKEVCDELMLKSNQSKGENTTNSRPLSIAKLCDKLKESSNTQRYENCEIDSEIGMEGIVGKLHVPEKMTENDSKIHQTALEYNQRNEESSDVDELDTFVTNMNNTKKHQSNKSVRKCQTCSEIFVTMWEFKSHLSIHPKGNIFTCKYCQKEFLKLNDMKIHLRSHTGSKPFQCPTCGMCFSAKYNLRKHEHTHKKDKPKEFVCETCSKTFSRKQYLQEHERTHSGSKPYACDVCHKTFVGKTGLNHHKKTHKSNDEKKSVVCEICGKSFTRHALWTHMKYHSKEHKCEFCSKCFATTAALKIHIAGAHLGHSWHNCNACGKGFIRKGHLIRHMKTHEEGKTSERHPCKDCTSKFKNEAHLKAHIKHKHTELDGNSPSCGICSKQFSTHSALKYHQRLHFHKRPHKCSICNKTFAAPYQLRDHTQLHHSKEKHFQCPVCEKKCATQNLLNKHLLTHRPTILPETKPPGNFDCNVCDKTFFTKLALSNHSRSHNFSRPYQCNHCRKAFRYQDSFLKHLQRHSENSETNTNQTKELPCIYTIQVGRPTFATVTSSNLEYKNGINDLPCNDTEQPTPALNDELCVDIPEKTSNISILQIKSVEESYLNDSLLQSEEVGFIEPIKSNSVCNASLEKRTENTSLSERSYSIIIDENVCNNSTLSAEGDMPSSLNFFHGRSQLQVPVVDIELSSHTFLPVETESVVVIDPMSVELPPEQAPSLNTTLAKEYSLSESVSQNFLSN